MDVVYADGCHPNHDRIDNRMPMAQIVDFPGYTGPPFFSEPSRRTWVVLLPHTIRHDEKSEVSRTQFPLCLAWALTPWKAQGMTLSKVIVKLSSACSKPGVLFVALSRVRHPDTLLLEDDFPAFSVIRRQLAHPSFAARQRWERRMCVLFSRTVREHMRDEHWFSETARWTQEESDLADRLVDLWRTNRNSTVDTLPTLLRERTPEVRSDTLQRTWARMQQYPHCFELAAARGELHSLSMAGTPMQGAPPVAFVGRLSFFGWSVDAGDVENFMSNGQLSESFLQAFLVLLRDRWPSHAFVFGPHLLRTRKVSHTLPQRRRAGPAHDLPLPPISCFPYRCVKSKHWVVYVRMRLRDKLPRLLLLKRPDVPAAALESTNTYISDYLKAAIEERDFPAPSFTDLSVLFACAALITDVSFSSFETAAGETVRAVTTFCDDLLKASAACGCTSLQELIPQTPALGTFVRDFFKTELPRGTARTFDAKAQRRLQHFPQISHLLPRFPQRGPPRRSRYTNRYRNPTLLPRMPVHSALC